MYKYPTQEIATPNYILPPGVTLPASLVRVSALPSTLTDINSFLMLQSRWIHNISPDGNCMFRALSHQIYGSDDKHIQVRQLLLDVIKANSTTYQPY